MFNHFTIHETYFKICCIPYTYTIFMSNKRARCDTHACHLDTGERQTMRSEIQDNPQLKATLRPAQAI